MQGESHDGSVRVAHLSRKGIIQPMQPSLSATLAK